MERAQRFVTKEKASVEIYGKPGAAVADLLNLSTSGACLAWNQGGNLSLAKGDVVRLTIFLKALNRRHHMSAEVVWIEGHRSGITFIKPDQVLTKIADKI